MEPVGVEHSWDAPHRLTNMVLFKLQRHADHHIHSTRRYHILHAEPIRSPQVSNNYTGVCHCRATSVWIYGSGCEFIFVFVIFPLANYTKNIEMWYNSEDACS